MCVLFIALNAHPRCPLIIAVARDEFYERPTEAAAFWNDYPHILAGRDLKGGGTWLGITRTGRFATVTNFRDLGRVKPDGPSRGGLVSAYLASRDAPDAYLTALRPQGGLYSGFNIVLGDPRGLWYFSNISEEMIRIPDGIHGISNHLLDTPWPKVERAKDRLGALVKHNGDPSPDAFFKALADTSRPDDSRLPDTGVGIEWERILSSLFVMSPQYGTRSSTFISVDRSGGVVFVERVYHGNPSRHTSRAFAFTLPGPRDG